MAILWYLIAAAAVALALTLRWAFAPFFGDNVPYLHLFPAIVIASGLGGFGPGLLATVLSALAADYYFLPPWA